MMVDLGRVTMSYAVSYVKAARTGGHATHTQRQRAAYRGGGGPLWRRASLGILATLIALGSAPWSPARAADPNAVAAAQELSRSRGGAASDFAVVAQRAVSDDPDVVWAGKLLDQRSGELVSFYRFADGSMGDIAALAQRRTAALARLDALAAKADAALLDALGAPAAADGGTTLPVAIWMSVDVTAAEAAVRDRNPDVEWLDGRPIPTSLEQARAIRGELWTARRDAYAAAAAALRPAVEAAGGRIGYVSTSAPLVFVDVSATSVAGLAERSDVGSIGLEGRWAEQMSSAGQTVRADWTSGSTDQGSGVRVGVVEYNNVRTTGDMAGQVVASYSTTGTLRYGTGSGDHPTWVAGAVAGTSATWRGTAPGADIVSASTGGYSASLATDRAVIAAADWAIASGGGDADILNLSLGQDTTQGAEEARRYFDSVGWEDGRLVVAASGNYGTFGHWDVVSPGTGYNVLTVGGVNDRNTAGWSDDILWYGSNGASYRDPTSASWNSHGDYNKPNLSAPAVSVRTANGMYGDGTSVASPIVAGIAAQLYARSPGLASWPEAARAILMAGALRRTPMPNGGLSADHEGVGTADAWWSNRVLSNGSQGGYRFGSMSEGEVPAAEIDVIAGQRIRVALAWSSHTSGSSNTGKSDTLEADLDLRVIAPNGAVVWSSTFDNSYEWLDVTVGQSGTLRMEIRSSRFDASSEPYGLAWAVSGPFFDSDDSIFINDILWAAEEGITGGCGAGVYCPNSAVTRAQMASFLVRAANLPPSSTDHFGDDESSIHENDINALASSGVTGGCDPIRYCPNASVSRAQMASFLVRVLDLPATSQDYFTDDEGSLHENDINALARAGVTGGCSAGSYCPNSAVSRGQMAAFLHRAFDP